MTSVTIQAIWNDELSEGRSPGQRQMKALGLLQIFAQSAERAFLNDFVMLRISTDRLPSNQSPQRRHSQMCQLYFQ